MHGQGKHCEVCGKGSMQRNLVSHSKRHAVRHVKPNLRRMRVQERGGTIAAIWVCAKCLKKGRVVAALPRRLARLAASTPA